MLVCPHVASRVGTGHLEHIDQTVFYEVAALLGLATLVGIIGVSLRQPLLVCFIAAGIIAGPDVTGFASANEAISLLAEIGIALLLFQVGLKLDLGLVRSLGLVAVSVGLLQITLTGVLGFFLALWLGIEASSAVYLAVGLMFSSTIVVVKLLSDKGEIDSLHGRIALGILIVQDIAVIVAMVTVSAMGLGGSEEVAAGDWIRLFGGGLLFLAGIGLFVYYAADPMLRRLAKRPELLVTFAISWAIVLAAVSDYLGLGKELGGLLAGVAFASSSYRETIGPRLYSLRDFLLLFFFVQLGITLDLTGLETQLVHAAAISAFILLGKPLIVLLIMAVMGYRRRTSFATGLSLGQISEFSLIFMAMGLSFGHVGQDMMTLTTLVALISIMLSAYMITYSIQVYSAVEGMLRPFERVHCREELEGISTAHQHHDVILFGLGRFGRGIAHGLRQQDISILGIDFDPEALRRWVGRGLPGLYGDVSDPEFVAHLPFHDTSWVILATPPLQTGLGEADQRVAMMRTLRDAGYTGRVAVTSHDLWDARQMVKAGADVVLNPFNDGAARAVEKITGQPVHQEEEIFGSAQAT